MGYCGKCGEKIEKGANFCGKCGAVVEKEQSEHVYDVIAPKNNSARVWKIIIPGLIVGVIVIWGFMQLMSVSDKPCDWCGHSPTVAYKESDGSYSYVCKECRKKCAWCGKKATRHYENKMHKEVFVCEETYKEMHDD